MLRIISRSSQGRSLYGKFNEFISLTMPAAGKLMVVAISVS